MHRASALARLAPRAAALTAAAAALCGCPEAGDLEIDYSVPTSIVIDPVAFLQGIPCSDAPGAMRSYVATITDRADTDPATPGTQAFTLPSSGPTPCSQRVQFRYVVSGHTYTAEIDGYELPADQLTPAGGDGSGSRQMDAQDEMGSLVEASPRWRIRCGERTVQEGSALVLEDCEILKDEGSSAPTAIRVDPSAALGGLRCAGEGGEIASFDVKPTTGGLPAVLGVPCPPAASVTYDVGIVPGQVYGFRIEAAGASSTYGSACEAIAVEGVTVPAVCGLLSSQGALGIPIGPVLQDAGLACPGGIESYVVLLESLASPPAVDPIHSSAVPCDEDARFAPLPPGPYQAAVTGIPPDPDQDNPPIAIAACAGEVIPGATTVATCSMVP
jgi:hypothetical protein